MRLREISAFPTLSLERIPIVPWLIGFQDLPTEATLYRVISPGEISTYDYRCKGEPRQRRDEANQSRRGDPHGSTRRERIGSA